MRRQGLDIWLHPQFERTPANHIGETDILDLGEFVAQLIGEHPQGGIIPDIAGGSLRRERQGHDRHIVDPAPHHERHRYIVGNAVEVGADLLVHAEDRIVGVRPHVKPGRDQRAVIAGLGVDVLDIRDRHQDAFERLGHLLDGVCRPEARRGDHDVDHRNRNLRLFLARDRQQGDQSDGER